MTALAEMSLWQKFEGDEECDLDLCASAAYPPKDGGVNKMQVG